MRHPLTTVRIALLTPLFDLGDAPAGGIAKHYRYLADALAEQGHSVSVVYIPDYYVPRVAEGVIPRGEVSVHCRPVKLPRWMRARGPFARREYVQKLLHIVRAISIARHAVPTLQPVPDVTETTSFGSLGLALGQRRIVTRVSTTGDQLSSSFQGLQSRALQIVNALERRAIKRSRSLVTHTVRHARLVEECLRLRPGTFAVVPHGIPDLPPATPRVRSNQGPTLLFVGQFTLRKGIDVVLAAAPAFLRARPDARLVIAGGPAGSPYFAHALRLHAEFGPRVEVALDPSDDALRQLVADADVVTAPSRYESFGLVYLEAMRAGKAVVATTAGGIPEVVSDGETGILVAPGDADALVAGWLRAVQTPQTWQEFGLAGRRRFLAHFQASLMAKRSVELYDEIIASTSVSPRA